MKSNRNARLTPEKQKLVESNVGLAYHIVGKHYRGRYRALGEYEDVAQEATIGLIYAANTYDQGSGYAFSTYACRCIANQLNGGMEALRRHKRNAGYEPDRLDAKTAGKSSNPATLGELAPGPFDVERAVYATLRANELRDAAARNGRADGFRALERNAVWGDTLEDIGRDRGCTKERVRQVINRVKNELREREGYLCQTYNA